RFRPTTPGSLAAGGTLWMLGVAGQPGYDTHLGQTVGVALPATWVPIPTPNSISSDPQAVYKQGLARGGTTFWRLEGCWFANGAVHFTSTSGGNAGVGQVWRYRPEPDNDLTLLYESPGPAVLDMPDNLTMSPRGGLLLCEDGGGGDNYLRGRTADGQLFDFAKNTSSLPASEFAGATYSPDGQWLFVDAVKEAVAEITAVDVALRGTPGVRALVGDTDGAARLEQLAVELDERVSRLDEELDAGRLSVAEDEIEAANRALVALKDAVW